MLKIEKTVKVSGAYRWYGRKEIEVRMWHPDYWDNAEETKNCVRIMFMSVDDAAVYRDFNDGVLKPTGTGAKNGFSIKSLPQ